MDEDVAIPAIRPIGIDGDLHGLGILEHDGIDQRGGTAIENDTTVKRCMSWTRASGE
jgi:hypothetical protein